MFSQCYILKKKADPIWNEGHPFPRDVDYMVADTLESLRPKLTMYTSLEQAVESLQKLNKEHQEQIGENVSPSIGLPFKSEFSFLVSVLFSLTSRANLYVTLSNVIIEIPYTG